MRHYHRRYQRQTHQTARAARRALVTAILKGQNNNG
ncbi:hypothetical protein SSEA_SKINNY_157 [Mycobacterium phage Skinny]|nr:hypothetical protein SSEA_SKINNY_157 [Mycobacterium phage Skinny]